MKKALFILLGLIGAGLVGYSVSQGWAGIELPIAGITINEPGYKFFQGIIAAACAGLGLVLLFVKPKIGSILGVVAALVSLWVYLSPPESEGVPLTPQKIIFGAVAGGVLIALAGVIAPAKK